jgi:dihydroneopterin aldolase
MAEASDPTSPAGADRTAETTARRQKIFVRDLTVSAHLGVTARERARAQRLRINVEAEVRPVRPLADDPQRIVDYRKLVPNIRRLIADGTPRLLETLADQIAQATFADDDGVEVVRVRIEKLDRYSDAAGIGIEIEHRRDGV